MSSIYGRKSKESFDLGTCNLSVFVFVCFCDFVCVRNPGTDGVMAVGWKCTDGTLDVAPAFRWTTFVKLPYHEVGADCLETGLSWFCDIQLVLVQHQLLTG